MCLRRSKVVLSSSFRSTPWVVFEGHPRKPGTDKRQEARRAEEGPHRAAGKSKGFGIFCFRPKDLSSGLPCRLPGWWADLENFENETNSRECRMFKAKLRLRPPERRGTIGEADNSKSSAPFSSPSGVPKFQRFRTRRIGRECNFENYENGGANTILKFSNFLSRPISRDETLKTRKMVLAKIF